MIKEYCDRCEKEIIKNKKKSLKEVVEDALAVLFGSTEERRFIICEENGTDRPIKLTLCKDCQSDLQQFMKKTEVRRIERDEDRTDQREMQGMSETGTGDTGSDGDEASQM